MHARRRSAPVSLERVKMATSFGPYSTALVMGVKCGQ